MEILFSNSVGLKWNIERINTKESVFNGTDKTIMNVVNIENGDYKFILTDTHLTSTIINYTVIVNDIIIIDTFTSDGIYAIINIKNGVITDKIFSTKKTTHIFGNVSVENEMNINENYDVVINPPGNLCMENLSNINLNYSHSRLVVDGNIKCDGDTSININKTGLIKASDNITEEYASSHGVVLKNASINCDTLKINIKNNGQISVNGNTDTKNSSIEINLANTNLAETGLIVTDDGTLLTSSLLISM